MPFLAVYVVRPCVSLLRCRMADQLKYFYDALPYRFPLERLFDRHAFRMFGFNAMKFADNISQFDDIGGIHFKV